ncbi:50S ribosomal protein L13 [Candidatus Uhrbacteria bacterium]|nr:50S ribosomal protein L13 [Candidatus Uhrbacteria bacterium]
MPWKKSKGMPKVEREVVEIDAAGKPVGRLATQIATVLMGKNKAGYEPRTDMGDRVKIVNADKIEFTGKKWEQKVYYTTSNRPGGLKTKPVSNETPETIIRHAVRYMLPKNKLQAPRMKRLTFQK